MDILIKQSESTYMSFFNSVTSADGSSADIMVDKMPTASVIELNKIYHYIGVTDANYTHGYFYECKPDGSGGYEWNEVEVQVDKAGQTIQLKMLPTASDAEEGNIYQYIGDTTNTLTHGYFYECKSNGETPAVYSWVLTNIQPETPIATEEIVGKVKPDGETIIIDPDGTIHALGGGGGIHLSNVSGAEATSIKETVYLKWSDPSDVVVSGITLAEWGGTKVLRKVDSAPTGIDDEDATVILDSKTRNAYSSTPLEDNTVKYGVQYYYKFFPYTVDDVVTNGSAVGIVPHRVVINIIPSQSGKLEYDGEAQSPTWSNYNTDELTIGGTTSGTAVGTYTATFTPKSDYMWSDGTRNAVDVTWAISNIAIAAVPTQDGTLSYTGESQSPTWNGYDTDELTISGDTAGTAIGTYTAVFTPKTNYEWWDGTTTSKNADWAISEVIITTVPTQQGTLTYNGTEQTAVWNNFDTDQLTIANGTGTNAGTYTASFTPKSGYKWSDGTTTAKTADFVIGKATGSITLSTNSVSLDGDHLSATITVTNPTGDVTVTSSDSTIVTASYSNGTITLTNPNEQKGTVTVTVSVAESSNYLSTFATIVVTNTFITYGSWSDSSDDNIIAMVAAADAGTLDLSLYWAVGDERTVHLSAIPRGTGFTQGVNEQYIVLVLMNEGYMNQQGIHYVVGQKDLFGNGQGSIIGSSNTWENSLAREALNNDYYNAFDSDFKTIFKTFDIIVAEAYNSSTTKTLQDRFAFFAEKEIWGSVKYGNAAEANELSQIEYYKTSSNRIKHYYNPATDKVVAERWWTRTPHARRGDWTVMATYYDDITYENVGYLIPCAPFGCI